MLVNYIPMRDASPGSGMVVLPGATCWNGAGSTSLLRDALVHSMQERSWASEGFNNTGTWEMPSGARPVIDTVLQSICDNGYTVNKCVQIQMQQYIWQSLINPKRLIKATEHSFWIGNVHICIVFCTILMTKQNKLGQFNPLRYPQRVFPITNNEQAAPLHEEKVRETLNEHTNPMG